MSELFTPTSDITTAGTQTNSKPTMPGMTPTPPTVNPPGDKTQKRNLHMRRASLPAGQLTALRALEATRPHDAKAISCLGSTVKKCVTSKTGEIETKASPNTDHISRIFPITTTQAQAIHKDFIDNLKEAKEQIQHYQKDLQPEIKKLEDKLKEAMEGLSEEAKEDLSKHLHSYFTSDKPVGDLGSILAKHDIGTNTDKYKSIKAVLLEAQSDSLFATGNKEEEAQNKKLVRDAETLQSRLSVFCTNFIGGVPDLTQDTIDNDLAQARQQIIESCERDDNTYVEQPALEFVERFSLMMVFNSKPSPFNTTQKTHKPDDISDLVNASMAGKIFSGYKYATIESLIAETIYNSLPEPNPETQENILQSIQSKRDGASQYCDTGGPRGRIDPRQSNSISSQLLPFPQGDSIAFVTNQSFALTVDQSTSDADSYKTLSQEATGLNDTQYNDLFNSEIKRNSRYETCATKESVPSYLIDIINDPTRVWPKMTDKQAQDFRATLKTNLSKAISEIENAKLLTQPLQAKIAKLKSKAQKEPLKEEEEERLNKAQEDLQALNTQIQKLSNYAVFLDCVNISNTTSWEAKPSFAAIMIDNGIRTICSCSGTTILITGQLLKRMNLKKEDRDKMLNSLYDLSVAENPASKLPLDKNLIKLISSISLCMQLQQAHSAGEVIAGLYQMACSNNGTQPTLEGFDNIMKLFKERPEIFLQIPDETTQDV